MTDLQSLTDVELLRRMESLMDYLVGEGATVNAAEVRELCSRLSAAPPPAGVLHPLAVAFLEARRAIHTGQWPNGRPFEDGEFEDMDDTYEQNGCPIWLEGK